MLKTQEKQKPETAFRAYPLKAPSYEFMKMSAVLLGELNGEREKSGYRRKMYALNFVYTNITINHNRNLTAVLHSVDLAKAISRNSAKQL
ncbi:MAG: hypothetical protein WCG19_06935 [Chlorobiaceae bacterium]